MIDREPLDGELALIETEVVPEILKQSQIRISQIAKKSKNLFYKFDENSITLLDGEKNPLACLEFIVEENNGIVFSTLQRTLSQKPLNGHFHLLFKKYEGVVLKKRAEFVQLEVDRDNINAIQVYEGLGFGEVAIVDTTSGNVDRIIMRYNLFNCE